MADHADPNHQPGRVLCCEGQQYRYEHDREDAQQAMKLRYRGKQIAALEKKQAKLAEKIAKLKRTSRAFKTEDEYLLWKAQFL